MNFKFEQISTYPQSVKLALLFLVIAWSAHFLFMHSYFPDLFPLSMIYKQAIVGVLICIFVAMIKRWARMLCIFFNVALVGIYLLFVQLFFSRQSQFYQDGSYLTFVIFCLVCFGASTYYLLTGSSSQFFKTFAGTQSTDGADST